MSENTTEKTTILFALLTTGAKWTWNIEPTFGRSQNSTGPTNVINNLLTHTCTHYEKKSIFKQLDTQSYRSAKMQTSRDSIDTENVTPNDKI